MEAGGVRLNRLPVARTGEGIAKAQLIEPGFCVIELKGEFDSLSKIPSGRQKFVKSEE